MALPGETLYWDAAERCEDCGSELSAAPRDRDPVVASAVVTGPVLKVAGGETTAIVTLLHDAVEEHGEDALERIHDGFGPEIASLVLECSYGGDASARTAGGSASRGIYATGLKS